MKQVWRLSEPFGVPWRREYLRLDVPAGMPSAAEVRALTDGRRVLPAQYDPESRALVCCVDLDAGQEMALEPTSQTAPDTGLRAEEIPGGYLLANGHCAVRLARGGEVRDAGSDWLVTGPLLSVTGPDGVPRGSSRVRLRKSPFFQHDRDSFARVNPRRVESEERPPTLSTRIEAAGPVFVRYVYELRLPDGGRYAFTAALYSDWPVLIVTEESNIGRDGDLLLAISEGFDCDLYLSGGVSPQRDQRTIPVPPAPFRLGSLAPHHTQSHLAYPWIGFLKSERPQGSFRGICDTAIEPFSDVLTVMARTPWTWVYPGEVSIQFECAEGRRITARGPIRRGARSWCLIVTDRKTALAPHRFTAGDQAWEVSHFAAWHRRINDIPLDWVRRLDLHSGAPRPGGRPGSVLKPQEFAEKKRGLFAKLAERAASDLARPGTASDYARWVMLGDREAAARLAQTVISVTENKLGIMLNAGFLPDACSAVALRCLGPNAVYFEACMEAGVLDAAQAERLTRAMLLFAHASAGNALFPCDANYLPPDAPGSIRNWSVEEQYSNLFGTPNFQTDVYYNVGLFGAVFGTHPEAKGWLRRAAEQLDRQLDIHFHPGGVYEESIGYFSHLFHNMLSLASVLRRHGERDFYEDPRFQAAMECLVDYLGAPRKGTLEASYPQHSKAPAPEPDRLLRYWPSIGDTGHDCAEARLLPLIGHAGWEVRAANPALSDKLLSAWQLYCGSLLGVHAPQFEFLYFQQSEFKPAPIKFRSRVFRNVGVMVRADVGKPSESSLFFRSGRATHHWGFDHGHFTLTTRGSLLIPDYGYHGTESPGGKAVHGSGTWLHNVVTFGPWWNGDTGMERRYAEPKIALGEDFCYIVANLCMNNVRVNNWRNIQPIVPVEYYRHLVAASNRYILVWDRIEWSIYRSQIRIGCLSRSVDIAADRLAFRGLDDVDLIVRLFTPEPVELREALVGPQRYVMGEQECQRDYLWVCQPLGPGEREFEVTHEPGLVRVRGTDLHGAAFDDTILYAKGDAGTTVAAAGGRWRLDGLLGIIHARPEGRKVLPLDADALAPAD